MRKFCLFAAVLMTAGCSGDGVATRTIGPSAPSSATVSPLPPLNPTISAMVELAGVLLTPAEVGTGFASVRWQYRDLPQTCGDARANTIDTAIVPTLRQGRIMTHRELGATVVEEVRIYQDVDEAARALEATGRSFACTKGTFYPSATGTGVPVAVGKPAVITEGSGADQAVAWTLTEKATRTVYAAARYRASLVTVVIQSPLKPKPGTPEVRAVLAKAIEKIETR